MKTLQSQGMTAEQFRKQVREQYIEQALRSQNVQKEIFISPYKIEKYFLAHQDEFRLEDQIKLRMIVLSKTTPDDTNALKLAGEIQAKIKDGTPFAEMAAVYSQGSQQHQGGDWGWVQRSVLRKELADVAFTLPPGQVSEVVDTSDTCYLMFVEEKKPAQVKPLTEVSQSIEKTLRIQEQAKLRKQWIEGLKKKTFIRYF
jgi:parvulin-like peptidyl-prolyl isomerase